MIHKIKGKWLLISHAGKVLGRHRTKVQAQAQERAISIAKARRAGHPIPYPR